ncbi:uncharacterized protein [Rutidosis leptorrhynchoides]|uniref:uncharacterized protein n=1 Tax=Rutidosis leptorrhynchoides TaxID=125765 RepID=UPI003A996659
MPNLDNSENSESDPEVVEIAKLKRKRLSTPVPRYYEEGETSQAAKMENAQTFLADMLKKLAPRDIQHKFEHPDVIQQMIEKYCTENKEVRPKKATEITFTIDKFVEHISDYPITTPPIVPATLGVYSGLIDPLDFLQRFEGVVSTYNWDEAIVCRIFPMVLQGLAREWFHNLNAISIAGFVDLREKFLLQFQNLLPQKKTHIECHDIKQGFKETLGSLLTRYIYECQKIPNLHEDQKISGFVHAINPQKHPTLVRRLRRDVPHSFAKVMQETYDYIRYGEDSNIMQNYGWGKDRSWRDDNDAYRDGNGDGYRDYNRGSGQQRRNNNGGNWHNDRQRNGGDGGNQGYNNRDRNYTRKWNNDSFAVIQTLTKSPKEILLQERVAKTFPDPPQLSDNNRRDKSKFCIFHDDYGHDTNRCRDLVELIADTVGQGKFNHLLITKEASSTDAIVVPALVATPKMPNVNTVVQQECKAPAVKNLGAKVVGKKDTLQQIQVINMVTVNGDTQQQKPLESYENWQLVPITFAAENDCAFLEEPIVISCKIAELGIQVMKVHIDTGSSVDVMYNQCFRKLPKDVQSKLRPNAMSLSGFSGESAWPIGQLELEIEVVDEQNAQLSRKAQLSLYVMNTVSRYNILLGRTTVCRLGIVSSPIQGMVKFATTNGIVTVTSAVQQSLCASVMLNDNAGTEGHMVVTNANVMVIE